MSDEQPARLADAVPDEPGIEATHAEHLPNGDFVPSVQEAPAAEAQGDISGELPDDRPADGSLSGLEFVDVD